MTLEGDRLRITSDAYGFTSEVTIVSGTALTDLGLDGTETDRGQDVVGKLIVGGVEESAVGTGRFLTGDSTNANTADVQVQVTLTSSQIQAGPEATLTLTRGIASQLEQVLDGMLDPVTGRLETITSSFQQSIDDLQTAIDRQDVLFELRRQALIREFVALERAVSQLRSAGDFLASQLLSINTVSAAR